MELGGMGRNDGGKKITATVGAVDHAIIKQICDARGISISQWIQECIAEPLYKAIASGYANKIKLLAEEFEGNEDE